MSTGKPTKTLADYLVIAISPVLIMILVHSLCFFLVDVFFPAGLQGGVRWVLFWYVLAVVLIARIGIEQSDERAMIYGLFLAGAVCLYLGTFHFNLIFGIILLGIVWFTAHKITLNCTMIDDEVDASGEGLMQSLRRLPRLLQKLQPGTKTGTESPAPPSSNAPRQKVKTTSSSAPGVWLIYYSLAALPIFGLGQVLLPAGDVDAWHRGLIYLFLYLAAALGLLVATSFLGLRRYLRQRYLAMPGHIAFGWVQFGVIAAGIVLCVTLLFPRPGAGEAWGTLRYKVDYQLRRASEYAARFNPHGSGSGRAGNQASADGQQENKNAQSDQKPDSNQNKGVGNSDQGDKQSNSGPKSDGTTGQSGGEKPGQPTSDLAPAAGSIYLWMRILFWLTVGIVLVWLLYRYRVAILTGLKSAWAAIRDFIASLLGQLRPAAAPSQVATKTTGVPPFKDFKNPFLTGSDQLWSSEQLIVYSYNALQSCALEQKTGYGLPQTPREFCRQLSSEMPDATDELEHLAFLYGHVAYGMSVPNNYNPEYLRSLWSKLPGTRAKN